MYFLKSTKYSKYAPWQEPATLKCGSDKWRLKSFLWITKDDFSIIGVLYNTMYPFVENWSVKCRDGIFNWRGVSWSIFNNHVKSSTVEYWWSVYKVCMMSFCPIPMKCPDRGLDWNHPQSFTHAASLTVASPQGFWPCYSLPGLLGAPLKSGLKLLSPTIFMFFFSALPTSCEQHWSLTPAQVVAKELGHGTSGPWMHGLLNSFLNILLQPRYPRSLFYKQFLSIELVFIPFTLWSVEFVNFHGGHLTSFLSSWWQRHPSVPQWAVLNPSPEHRFRALGEFPGCSVWPAPPIGGAAELRDAQELLCGGSSMVHLFSLVLRTLYFLRYNVGSYDLKQSFHSSMLYSFAKGELKMN